MSSLPWARSRRFALREFDAQDLESLVEMHRDARLREHLVDDYPMHLVPVVRVFLERMAQIYRHHEGLGIWPATLLEPEPAFAGWFSLMPIAGRSGEVEIGSRLLPRAWGSGLALDETGFIATGATLQSSSHPEVFAVGDVATRSDAPHPKSGVYAVRAGPPLALNLRRFVAGGHLVRYLPQPRSLNLLACGERYAIGSWGDWSFEGRWVWWWKDRIDRAFVARYR